MNGKPTEMEVALAPWGKFLNDDPSLPQLNAKLPEWGKLPRKSALRENVWNMLCEYAGQNEWVYDAGLKSFVPFQGGDS